MKKLFLLFYAALTLLVAAGRAAATELAAYSMRQAEAALKAGGELAAQAQRLDGITRVVAVVIDPLNNDPVIVGERDPKMGSGLALHELVIALRARLVNHKWPLVSIDRSAETASTGLQVVRFDGGSVAGTSFGASLLAADVALKKIALDLAASAEIWGVTSYFKMCVRAAAEGTLEERVSSRFWFRPLDSSHIVVREGVAVIQHFRLGVQAEMLSVNGQAPTKDVRDKIGDRFAATMTERLPELSAYFPEVARLTRLFELVAIAHGLEMQQNLPDMGYWLKEFKVPAAETPATYALLKRSERLTVGGVQRTLELDGGVELRASAIRLSDGDVTALRDIVLRSRPARPSLSWRVPVDATRAQNAALALRVDASSMAELAKQNETADPGTSITRSFGAQLGTGGTMTSPAPSPTYSPSHFNPPATTFKFSDHLSNASMASNIGGVMLASRATVAGAGALPDLSAGGFSLVVEGAAARLSPEAFRRFVTALWAVYFSEQAPGISIDPIAPGVNRHAVRYIGNVVNTDLSRVMRVSDYRMKQAVVLGGSAFDVPGFQDIEALSDLHGMPPIDVLRRFWFVPEGMTFKRSGSTLMFDKGRMTLKTEIMAPGMRGRASAADQAFTRFFTENYATISSRYPVFGELFEYAKFVSLATFVKDQKVPLLWFLLANKDQVLTEDSPGTVEALARDSRHRPNIKITGGVKMQAPFRYVVDAELDRALAQAATDAGPRLASGRPAPGRASSPQQLPGALSTLSEPQTFTTPGTTYSALPDQWLTAGDNGRGFRFQTDLALHDGARPGLELVRMFDPSATGGEFGAGWRVLVPYSISAVGDDKVAFLNAKVPGRMVVENRLTGRSETLTFSADRYRIAGYVPEPGANSQFIGLFILSNGSFRLADKLGGEYAFDSAGALKKIVLTDDYAMLFDYLDAPVSAAAQNPIKLQPLGDARVNWRNVTLPERLQLLGLAEGPVTLRFSERRQIVGYEPDPGSRSSIKFVALLSDGSMRAASASGDEWLFRADGQLKAVLPDPAHRLVSSLQMGKQRVQLEYELDDQARPRVARAVVRAGEGKHELLQTLAYRYDAPGRLAQVASAK